MSESLMPAAFEKAPVRKLDKEDAEVIEELSRRFGPSSNEVLSYLHTMEIEDARAQIGLPRWVERDGEKGPLLKLVDKVLKQISAINLIKLNKHNEERLEAQKKQVQTLLAEVYTRAAAYTEAVNNLRLEVSHVKSESEDSKHYQNRMQVADQRRRSAHNALISDIMIALRYINEHFADYSESALEDIEEKFANRNEPFLNVKRVKLPENIFLPDKLNIKVRQDLGSWAIILANELANYSAAVHKKQKS